MQKNIGEPEEITLKTYLNEDDLDYPSVEGNQIKRQLLNEIYRD